MAALIDYIVANHPELLPRLLGLWSAAIPWQEGSRVGFAVDWTTGSGGELRFDCTLTAWSDFDAAWAFDWHPANGATWEWLGSRCGASGSLSID